MGCYHEQPAPSPRVTETRNQSEGEERRGEERRTVGIGEGSDNGHHHDGRRLQTDDRRDAYFRCFPTSLVISNMLTTALPPNTVFSAGSALIIRLFFGSCSLFFLM
jgi:hypothetical protein